MNPLAQLQSALADRYNVLREIGAGGMATVYLAGDVRHNRKVALKVLKPELGLVLGTERFLTEIETTANLQHPHLLPLFDSGEVDGLMFYVMPYIEGETLRARLERERQLPVDEAVRIAVAIASALDYAHRRGVIHRDLKPENILLHDGQPLVADFGIALAVSNAGGARITQTGLSLGTPQYMSPEQATGDRQLDGRTDIYSLGAMLYEMLTGDPPHTGSSAQAVIAKVLTDRPPSVRTHRASVPVQVDRAVEVALAKLAADRFATAAEFAEALQGTRAIPLPAAQANAVPAAKARQLLHWGIAAAAIVSTAWLATRGDQQLTSVPAEFEVALPAATQIRGSGGSGITLGISRDGSMIVYKHSQAGDLFVRSLDDSEPRPIRGTEYAADPTFSPDGKWILFSSRGTLKKVPIDGGPVIVVADSGDYGSWGDRNEIVYSFENRLFRVPADGGQPALLADASKNGHVRYSRTQVLPGGKAALITLWKGVNTLQGAQLGVVTLADGRIKELGLQGGTFRYAASGHVLYGRDGGTVFAAPFSLNKLEVIGPAVPLIEEVVVRGNGATDLVVAENGTIAYVRGRASDQLRQLVAVDRNGAQRLLSADSGRFLSPRISPDGRLIALESRSGEGQDDVWVFDVSSGVMSRFTNNGTSFQPVWSRDGQNIAYIRLDNGSAEWQAWDRSGAPAPLITGATIASVRSAAIIEEILLGPRPGHVIARIGGSRTVRRDILIANWDSLSAPQPLLATDAQEVAPALSPDGKLLAWVSDESGRREVYVRAFPGPAGRMQVSINGGVEPVWAPDSRELFYRTTTHMVSATIASSPAFSVTARDTLFADSYSFPATGHAQYDVFPNGKELLMLRARAQSDTMSARLVVLMNWNQELQRRAPRRNR